MRMNKREFLAMNNPGRRFLMKHLEWPVFKKIIQQNQLPTEKLTIIDLACGSGYSIELLNSFFSNSQIFAFDLMPEQLKLAQKRTKSQNLFQADVCQIPLKNNSIDLATGFGILHHVVDWKKAIAEIARVLKPGGYLLIEEPHKNAVCFFRDWVGFIHPKENRFDWLELEKEFENCGIKILGLEKVLLPIFRFYLATNQLKNDEFIIK